MRKTYLYMTAVVMSAALATGCQKAEPVETTAAAETVAESTGTGTAENESSETSGTDHGLYRRTERKREQKVEETYAGRIQLWRGN